MNRDEQSSIPDELRDRFEQEASAEQEDLERVWHLLGAAEPSDEDAPSADESWTAIRARITSSSTTNNRPSSDHRPADRPARSHRAASSRRTWGITIAAGLLILMIAGAWFWKQPAVITAPPGEHVTATLPDGSTVELNSGTSLSHSRDFNAWPFVPAAQRTVHLEGEAFFDVQPGERPFIVETFNARVEVLGTSFNVRARADTDAEETRVTLTSGRLRIRAAQRPDSAVLLTEAGQSSRVTASLPAPTDPEPVRIEQALAWRQQGFAVSDWPLSTIFTELERRYNTTIIVTPRTALSDSMTLYYPQHTDVETIIHDIAIAKDLTYRATSQGYRISSK